MAEPFLEQKSMMAEVRKRLKQGPGAVAQTAIALSSFTMVVGWGMGWGMGWSMSWAMPELAEVDSGPSSPTLRASGDTADPIPGVVQPYCASFAQQPLNRCIGRWLTVAERLHELVYEEVFFSIAEDKAQQLETVHQQWLQFQDEHCDLVAQQVLGGSAYPMLWGGCRASLTNERIAALQFWGEVAMEPDQAFQQLQQLDAELQPEPDTDWSAADAFWQEFGYGDRSHAPRYDVAQSLWLDYRKAHCKFESMQLTTDPYFPGIEEVEDWIAAYPDLEAEDAVELRCHTRLTVERLEQLKDLAGMGW